MTGLWAALLSAFLWAMTSVLMAWGARRISVLPLNLIRCSISLAFFLALLPFYGGWQAVTAIPSSSYVWLVVSVLCLLVVGDTLYFRSLNLAGVSWAMPVASINPLWAVLLAALFLDEPLSWTLLGGALLVIGGVVLVNRSMARNGANSADPAALRSRRTGLLLAFLVSILWGVGQVALRPATVGITPVVANSVRQVIGLTTLVGLNLVWGQWRELKTLDRRSWTVIGLASLVGTGIGSLFFVLAIQLGGAGRTAILTTTSPMLAIPFSMLWLHERPTLWTIAGTVLTVAGIALMA